MNITDQLKEIGVFLAEDRFIPILEEVAMSPMAAVVGDGVAGEKSSHHRGDRDPARPKQEMNVIRKQDPGIAGSGGLGKNVFPADLQIDSDPGHPGRSFCARSLSQ